MKLRQVPIFLYWRVENVQFWINSIGHLGWLSCILNFPRFHKNVNSLEFWKYISENSSPKGSFWRNKRKSEFSSLSADSRYLLAVALKLGICTKMLRFEIGVKNSEQNFPQQLFYVENVHKTRSCQKCPDVNGLIVKMPIWWLSRQEYTTNRESIFC